MTEQHPIGIVLAGGAARRLGGQKASADIGGEPLLAHVVAALREVCDEVAVVAKPETDLPEVDGVLRWDEESGSNLHPIAGIVHALRCAKGRPILACPLDLPFVTGDDLRALAERDAHGACAVVARCEAEVQPLLGRFEPGALELLEGYPEDAPVREIVLGLAPSFVHLTDECLFNLNTEEDLAEARERYARRAMDGHHSSS